VRRRQHPPTLRPFRGNGAAGTRLRERRRLNRRRDVAHAQIYFGNIGQQVRRVRVVLMR
jgi:hypothetical protein